MGNEIKPTKNKENAERQELWNQSKNILHGGLNFKMSSCLLFALLFFSSFLQRSSMDTTDLFMGLRYGMDASNYISYLQNLQQTKPIRIQIDNSNCNGIPTPIFSYFGFDFTDKFDAAYVYPYFNGNCKLQSISVVFRTPDFSHYHDNDPHQDQSLWDKIKGEKTQQEKDKEDELKRAKDYPQSILDKVKKILESKYGAPAYNKGYYWDFGHKKIYLMVANGNATIDYKYDVPEKPLKKNASSDL